MPGLAVLGLLVVAELSLYFSTAPTFAVAARPLLASHQHLAVTAVSRLAEAAWCQRLAEVRAEVLAHPDSDVLFLGDSLTQGFRRHPDLWNEKIGPHALNGGITGDGTQHLLWRLRHGEFDGLDPKVVVILIGTNNGLNSATEIAEGIYLNVLEAEQRFPRAHVLLVGMLPSGKDPQGRRRRRNAAANRLVAEALDGKRARYLDLESRFLGPGGQMTDAMLGDALHLTRKGYEILAAGLQPEIQAPLAAPLAASSATPPATAGGH
jgi:lysophospholipase L1-like esterase